MKTYKTSQIAEKCGVHPNTVRLYEELCFIPPVPRVGNGYRLYSEMHLEHALLVRMALKSTWLGGVIRQKALSVLHLSAAGSHEEAMQEARDHLVLVREEREKAEIAARHLEAWAAISDDHAGSTMQYRKTKEIAERLDISQDMLRSWERNGLITVPRDPDNGYRMYGEEEIRRLYVIRALRKARFNLMSIHRMFQQYDRGVREGLTGILNELPPDEEDILYHTDQWLTKIRSIEESAHEMIKRLYMIKNLHEQ
jgi:DNA-binding transcriptional MerR regulator